jgi:hypothetical protein
MKLRNSQTMPHQRTSSIWTVPPSYDSVQVVGVVPTRVEGYRDLVGPPLLLGGDPGNVLAVAAVPGYQGLVLIPGEAPDPVMEQAGIGVEALHM